MPKKVGFKLNRLLSNPKRLFLIDSLGALLTTFFLSVILIKLEEEFGMPHKVLTYLSILAGAYAIYSICCYFFIGKGWRPFLYVIAFANLLYCCITIVFVILFFQELTILGLTYFLGEILIIGALICIELAAVSKTRIEN